MKMFEDVSIFQGWMGFGTPEGKILVESDDSCYKIYTEEDNEFIHRGSIKIYGDASPKTIYDKACEAGILGII